MSIDTEEIEAERTDFRRANGAPQWVDRDGKNQRGSRPSGWGKELDDENALVNWKLNRSIAGVAKDTSIAAAAIALKDDDRPGWADIRERAIQAGRGNQASDLGTALHAMSERWEQEEDFDPGSPYRESLEAYTTCMKALGLVSQRFEFQMVNEEYRAAGTADRLYELTQPLTAPDGSVLPAGTLVIGDLKTGQKFDFSAPGYCIQMAIYAQGQWYDVAKDEFVPTPDINQRWGLLVHMPSGQEVCTFHWCDLEVGNYGAWLVSEVREWRKKWRGNKYDTPVVDVPGSPPSSEGTDPGVPEAVADIGTVYEPSVGEWVAWGRDRLKKIGQHTEARAWVQTWWPETLPKPKDIEETVDAVAFLDFLDQAEAKFELPFPDGDPRRTDGLHQSEIPPRLGQEKEAPASEPVNTP